MATMGNMHAHVPCSHRGTYSCSTGRQQVEDDGSYGSITDEGQASGSEWWHWCRALVAHLALFGEEES